MLCAKKIRRALKEDKAPIKPFGGQVRAIGVTAAPSSIQITLDNILFFLGKTELNVKEGAGYLRSECELDLEDEDEDAGSVKKKSLLNVLDRTEPRVICLSEKVVEYLTLIEENTIDKNKPIKVNS